MNIRLKSLTAMALGIALAASLSNVDAQPEVKQQGDISYVSGGVAVEGRDALDAIADQFNLKVVLAWDAGNYVSGVRIDIYDSQGNSVLNTETEGPWLFASLAPETYTVMATYEGAAQEQSVEVTADQLTEITFTW